MGRNARRCRPADRQVGCYAPSKNNTLGASDRVLAKVPVPALFSNQSVSITARIKILADFPLDSYYIGYWINRAQATRGESSLQNNTRVYSARYYQKGSFWTFGGGCRGSNKLVPRIYAASSSTDPHSVRP